MSAWALCCGRFRGMALSPPSARYVRAGLGNPGAADGCFEYSSVTPTAAPRAILVGQTVRVQVAADFRGQRGLRIARRWRVTVATSRPEHFLESLRMTSSEERLCGGIGWGRRATW